MSLKSDQLIRSFKGNMAKKDNELILEQIEQAKIAISKKKCFFYADSKNSVMELMNLDIDSSDEIWPLISDLLTELKPEHQTKIEFNGSVTLPAGSYFFTFIWDSIRLKKKVKLTFVLNLDHFYYFSLS